MTITVKNRLLELSIGLIIIATAFCIFGTGYYLGKAEGLKQGFNMAQKRG